MRKGSRGHKEFLTFFTEQRGRCEHLTLVANSIGAFFALSSLDETLVDRAYFISPIVNMDKPFWADSCPVKSCCENKSLQHCGECDDFVCPLLHTFAYDMEQSDNGARIEQCKKWCNNNGLK